jgi:monofunctional biosynthetic peptidoglycan transglycosylase
VEDDRTRAEGDRDESAPEELPEEGEASAVEQSPEVEEPSGIGGSSDVETPPNGDAPLDAEVPPDTEASPDAAAPPGRASPWPRRLRLGAIVLGVTAVAWLLFTWITWPDVAALRTENPPTTAFIERYRKAQREAGRDDAVAWQPVPYDRISQGLKRAVVASEDTEFFFHNGFSSHEMTEALKKAIREREAPRGASTITQQVAKNLWLTPRRSLTRKLREAILTRQLEKQLSKTRILDLYLNIAEFGPGIYGAEAAARRYFGVPASALSPRHGAMLAAGLPRPKQWNPSSGSEYYRRRVERILGIQAQLRYLDRYIGPAAPGPTSQLQVAPPEVAAEAEPLTADTLETSAPGLDSLEGAPLEVEPQIP